MGPTHKPCLEGRGVGKNATAARTPVRPILSLLAAPQDPPSEPLKQVAICHRWSGPPVNRRHLKRAAVGARLLGASGGLISRLLTGIPADNLMP